MITDLKHYKSIREAMDNAEENGQELLMLQKDLNGEVRLMDPKQWTVDHVLDVIVDQEEIKKLENFGAVNTDLSIKDVDIGSTVWMTAMLKPKNGSVANSAGTIGVLKLRVQQVYYGLSKLQQLKQQGKL